MPTHPFNTPIFSRRRATTIGLLSVILAIASTETKTQPLSADPLKKKTAPSTHLQQNSRTLNPPTLQTVVLPQISIEVRKNPEDRYPPYDLDVRVTVRPQSQVLGQWTSSQLIIKGDPDNPAIGGSNQCSELPIPNQNLAQLTTPLVLRTISNNSFGAGFDWRLYPGSYVIRLQLFSNATCDESSLLAEIEKNILISP